MGRGRRHADNVAQPRSRVRLPKEVREALTPAVAHAWRQVAPILPEGMYLGGGTGTALRLHHRRSRDLDFFYHDSSADLDALEEQLNDLGAATTLRSPGTLRMMVGSAKVEFLHADETGRQHRLEAPEVIAGIPVAGLQDLMAMKLKVLAERGELRDYYDVMRIDLDGRVSLEDGIEHFLTRYGLDRASEALRHLIRSLGYLDDVEQDDEVPMSRSEIAQWWSRRQARLIRNLGP